MFNQLYLNMFLKSIYSNGFNFVLYEIDKSDITTPLNNVTYHLWFCRVFPINGEPLVFYFCKKSDCLRFSNKYMNRHTHMFWSNILKINLRYSYDFCLKYCVNNNFDPLS